MEDTITLSGGSVAGTQTAVRIHQREQQSFSTAATVNSSTLSGQEEITTATTTGTPDRMSSRLSVGDEDDSSSLKENNIELVVDSTSTTTLPSSLKEFDSEIRRMSARADKLIDSFRRQAAIDERSNYYRTRSRSSSGSLDSSNNGIGVEHDQFHSLYYADSDDDDVDHNHENPVSSSHRIRSQSDLGDDSMNDELDRLEEATAVIRESLDRSDRLTESQIQSLLWSTSNNENHETTTTSPTMSILSNSSSRQPHNTPSTLSSRRSPTILKTTTIFSSQNCGSPINDETMSTQESTLPFTPTSSSSTSPSSRPPSCPKDEFGHDVDRDDPLRWMGSQEALLLAVTVVWAAIVMALVQARYCMLDEDGFLFAAFSPNNQQRHP